VNPRPPGGSSRGRSSLVGRLVLLAAAWSLAVLVLAGIALSVFFDEAELTRFDTELAKTIEGLLAGTTVEHGVIKPPAITSQRSQRAFSGSYWQIVTAGPPASRQLITSRSLWDRTMPIPRSVAANLAKAPGGTVSYNIKGPLNQPLRAVAMQARLPDVTDPVIFIAAEDQTALNSDIRTFDATIAIALVLLGAGLIAAVIIQVRVGLEPLFALRREVAAVRTGESERIVGEYPTELQPLAQELNALMAHTQEVVERQRTHVGNLAHALKTPLSVLLTEAGQQPGSLAEVVTRQAQTMGQHIDHHLRRARAAARAQGQGERTQVAPVIEDLSRTLERIFHGKVSAVDWECPEDLYFLGERQDLLEIAGNVMENACKWCRGRVRVEAQLAGARRLRLLVEDDGPGLPPEQRGTVLKRGARLDERTPGSGLGLAIVDELVRAYGGTVTLATSPMGGLKVILMLPRAEV
jgi:signal transduction histidine kinase